MARSVGVDFGRRRVGLAVSDETDQHVFPRPTVVIDRLDDLQVSLRQLMKAEPFQRLVVGLPLSLSGQEGPQAKEVRAAMDQVGRQLGVPVVYQDERLTTAGADRYRQSTADRDSLAAVAILESFLERTARS